MGTDKTSYFIKEWGYWQASPYLDADYSDQDSRVGIFVF
jgi:hypothetical protein